jgi:hypothetical protein
MIVRAEALPWLVVEAARRGHGVALGEAPGVFHGNLLGFPVAVMDQLIPGTGPAGMDRLLRCSAPKPARAA